MLAIKGGKILTVTHGVIEDGAVLVGDNGKIAAVLPKGAALPSDAEVLDFSGCFITPGLIDPHTHVGNFGEPTMTASPSDGNEYSGPINPALRVLDALNPHDWAISSARAAGFTTLCTLPGSANIIGGTGVVFKLRGDTAEQMVIPGKEQMKMALGENPRRAYGVDRKQKPTTRMATAALLRQTLWNAKNYSDQLFAHEDGHKKEAPRPDFELNALLPVVRGEMKCRVHCHRADDIMTALRIAEEFSLDISIEHCTEGFKIPQELKKRGVTCVIGPIHSGPYKQEIWERTPFNVGILDNAGVNVCMTADSSSRTDFLPCEVGYCIARGLREQSALEAVTIRAARLLGVDSRVGSLEPGKDADIAVWSGYPFSNLSRVKLVMIDGVIYEHAI